MDTTRKPAPSGVEVRHHWINERKELVDRLDAENPDFVHSYQNPGAVTGDRSIEWEMEAKGQEVVKDKNGKLLHHLGDPVVRMKRIDFERAREQEADLSRDQVESVVKPDRSTVKRKPQLPAS